MNRSGRFSGTLRTVYAHWPAYLLAYSGMIVALILIGVGAWQGWLSLIPLGVALLLVQSYFLSASLWAAHQLYDSGGICPHHVLFDMSHLQETDCFAYVDLDRRQRAIDLSRRLTTGQVIVVDVYNPQWTTSRALARQRAHRPPPPPDPRLVWRDGEVSLIPLPDNSVPAVIVAQIVSEFWQHGDRLALLREVHRILAPDGRLLLAERVRTQTNWLVMGPAALTLHPASYWHNLLGQAGFRVQREQDLLGLIRCIRAVKPTPAEAQQMAFDLNFEYTQKHNLPEYLRRSFP